MRSDQSARSSENETAASDPGASDPGASEPGASEPGASEPGAAEPVASEPVVTAADPAAGRLWRYLVCVAIAYALLRLLGPGWRTGFPARFPDSSSYTQVAGAGPLSTTFWFGPRPPTYPFLIWLVGPSPRAVVAAQTLLAVAAWGWLVSTVWTAVRSRWVSSLVVGMLLLTAIESRWVLWSTALLTESLSATLAVALVAAWWRWWDAPTVFRTSAAVAITAAWMLLRDSNAVTLLVVAAPAFPVVLVMERRRTSGRRRLMGVGLAAIVLVGAYSLTAQITSDRGATSFHNNVALRWLPDPEMGSFMEAWGMPISPALRERAGNDAWADGEAMLRSPALAEYRRWAAGPGRAAAAASLVVRADWYLARAHRELPIHTQSDLRSYDTFDVADRFPERPLWRIDPVDSRTSMYVWSLFTVVGLGALWFVRRTQAWLGLFLFVPVVADLYLTFAGDAVEVARHLVGPLLRFSVVAVVVVGLAADALIAHRGDGAST